MNLDGFAYSRILDLADASRFRRAYLLGVLAKVMVAVAQAVGKPLALEDLAFLLHNGLSRAQQEDRRSIWRDFKGLALALRRLRLAGNGKNR